MCVDFSIQMRTKIRPAHLAVSGALKTIFVFDCGKMPAKQVLCSRRSKVSASRPYAPDTRGVCFQGPSRALWYLISRGRALHGTEHSDREVKSGFDHFVRPLAGRSAVFRRRCICHRFASLHCAVTADAGLPLSTQGRAGAAV